MPSPIEQLIQKGVEIPNPQSVEVGQEVSIDRLAGQGVTIHAGCKIFGKETLVCEGAQIGYEGPATLVDCYVGPQVSLNAGYFSGAVFLKKSVCGLGAHIRQGTILEEEASVAHTVGLKQTILFPFVTLGSLINFCDCLMAGGTGPQHHSEVGSAYIHFNFTPDQDKATASLIGDVPKGVMLNQSPIFLGGQGALVGPCRIAYGTVLAAGSICRKDQLKEDRLVMAGSLPNAHMPLSQGTFRNLKRILTKNFIYIGNLYALMQWYQWVRRQFVGAQFPQPLLDGLIATLQSGIDERLKQLKRLKDKVADSAMNQSDLHTAFSRSWEQIHTTLLRLQQYEGPQASRELFLKGLESEMQKRGKDYIAVIRHLEPEIADSGSQWLQSIVEHLTAELFSFLAPDKQ